MPGKESKYQILVANEFTKISPVPETTTWYHVISAPSDVVMEFTDVNGGSKETLHRKVDASGQRLDKIGQVRVTCDVVGEVIIWFGNDIDLPAGGPGRTSGSITNGVAILDRQGSQLIAGSTYPRDLTVSPFVFDLNLTGWTDMYVQIKSTGNNPAQSIQFRMNFKGLDGVVSAYSSAILSWPANGPEEFNAYIPFDQANTESRWDILGFSAGTFTTRAFGPQHLVEFGIRQFAGPAGLVLDYVQVNLESK